MRVFLSIAKLVCKLQYLLALLLLTWHGGFLSAEVPTNSPLWQRLLREAPSAWERQYAYSRSHESWMRHEKRELKEGAVITTRSRSRAKQSGNFVLTESEEHKSQSWHGSVSGENSQYSFQLTRTDENKPWVIVSVQKVESSDEETGMPPATISLSTPEGLTVLPALLKHEVYKPIDISADPENKTEELVRVSFRFSSEDKQQYPKGGLLVVVLDPKHDWVLRKSEFEVELGGDPKGRWKTTEQCDYRDSPEGLPELIRSEEHTSLWQNDKLVSERHVFSEGESKHRKTIPESEFTLSAYGLPEPYWVVPKKKPWYLWLGIGGVVCLVLGAGVFWFKRRRVAALVGQAV